MSKPSLKHNHLTLTHHSVHDTPFFFFGQYNIWRHLRHFLLYRCFRRSNKKGQNTAEPSPQSRDLPAEETSNVNKMGDTGNPSYSKRLPRRMANDAASANRKKDDVAGSKVKGRQKEENVTAEAPPPDKRSRDNDSQTPLEREVQTSTPVTPEPSKHKRPGVRIHTHGPVQYPGEDPRLLQAAVANLPIHNPNTASAYGYAAAYTMGNQGIRQHVETSTKTGVFHLSKAKLHEFPPELAKIVNALRSIDLSENKISLIPQNISAFANLKHLNLSYNQIELIPDQIGQLSKLETLSLANNRIKSVPATIAHLQKLRDVNLNSNQLSTFPTVFSSLKFLTVLDLAHNRIPEVPDGVGGLQVVELILNQNQIRVVSKDLARCPNLKTLRLQENTLELAGLPKEILSDSPVSLLSVEGNLFDVKQLSDLEGYEQYMERYTSTKKKLT